ncbi:hypothetical protein Q428_01365 [Fervidicella metallireducens AeB]|uniref:Prepilin-type N-terminal cleavage/methylation domain-containing protein n=1 Tax=Fervidicella metallireducens AeB TaxID=1403537 RepID=A0A017S0M0_9CLOT|nr:type II secretion system protein [Fervidicella metallireducens]EYE89730.1 hypothetical protein Q428_01365 [Fervidicella metallireducens AeB]
MMDIKNKKRYGVTLIEIMISLTIVVIVFTAAASTFVSAFKSAKNEEIKLETMTGVQSTIQCLRMQGVDTLEAIYNLVKNKDGSAKIYLLYDDIKEIVDEGGKLNFGQTISDDFQLEGEYLKTYSLEEAENKFGDNRKFYLCLEIYEEKYNNNTTNFRFYNVLRVKVTIGKLNDKNIFSEGTAYFGG